LEVFKEQDGQYSARRVLSFLGFVASVALSYLAIVKNQIGWYHFIPTIAFIVLSIALLYFTTKEDVWATIDAVKGKKEV
jgi:hypothetical protein